MTCAERFLAVAPAPPSLVPQPQPQLREGTRNGADLNRDEYRQGKLSLTDVAQHVHVCASNMSQIVREVTGRLAPTAQQRNQLPERLCSA